SQCDDLLFLFFAQDIAHVTERNSPPVQCPDSAISLAGFQVSTYGRFWVSPEELASDGCSNRRVWVRGLLAVLAEHPSIFILEAHRSLEIRNARSFVESIA